MGLEVPPEMEQFTKSLVKKRGDRVKRQKSEKYNEQASSFWYQLFEGWLFPEFSLPPLDPHIVFLYNAINNLQLVLLIGLCIYCLRWVYADGRVEGRSRYAFAKFCATAVMTNLFAARD